MFGVKLQNCLGFRAKQKAQPFGWAFECFAEREGTITTLLSFYFQYFTIFNLLKTPLGHCREIGLSVELNIINYLFYKTTLIRFKQPLL